MWTRTRAPSARRPRALVTHRSTPAAKKVCASPAITNTARAASDVPAYIREHFFGPDPRLRAMVEDMSDDDIWRLRRGGLDYRKVYAAYDLATELNGAPTVILAKTIKGWTLGPDVSGKNATHQIKKLTPDQLRGLRDRLHLENEISDAALEG